MEQPQTTPPVDSKVEAEHANYITNFTSPSLPPPKLPDILTAGQSKKRSTFTEENARFFAPFFKQVMEQNRPLQLSYEAIPYITRGTFYIKMTDALRWLVLNEKDPEMKARYILVRAMYSFSPQEKGIMLRRKINGMNSESIQSLISEPEVKTIVKGVTTTDSTTPTTPNDLALEAEREVIISWRDVVMNFITREIPEGKTEVKETVIFEVINDEDKLWIAQIFDGVPSVDYLFSDNKLTMMKVL